MTREASNAGTIIARNRREPPRPEKHRTSPNPNNPFVLKTLVDAYAGMRTSGGLLSGMVIAGFIMLWFELAVGVGPYTQGTWVNLLPGLLFVNPSIIHTLTGKVIDSMDVTFWSLYVEVCFYVVFSSAYFILGSTMAIVGVFVLFALTYFAELIASGGDLFSRAAAAP